MSPVVKKLPVRAAILQAIAAVPGRGGVDLWGLLLVTLQLGLLLVVMHAFGVEERMGLLRLTPLVFAGFIVHALLPRSLRLPFFLALSLGGIGLVLGPWMGAALVGLGLGLIGLCHLPVPFRVRVVLVVGAGVGLAALRGGWVPAGWEALPAVVLPVLGAMFMFRLAIYLYDLRHERTPASVWERLSYFFMLPNVCFLLFPVVDYQAFRRTYYDGADELAVYRKGVQWMYRGVVQLLAYRLVYYHLVPDPTAIAGLGGVVQSMLTIYLLYLRISGQFHLIVGILCLFGFNLPETHHLYFLASSFNDYWRRINIYWKDFMMKIFYYPSLMQLRRWGMTVAIAGATAVVFFATWVLHAYQWFWLRGTFPITGPDALFWGILGGLVVVNALGEARRGRPRGSVRRGWDARAAVVLSLKTVGMFTFLTVLWSLWSSHSVREWIDLVAEVRHSSAAAVGLFVLGLAALVGVGVLLQYAASRGWAPAAGGAPGARSALATSGVLALLLLASLPAVQERLGAPVGPLFASLKEEGLSRQDAATLEQGYYEGLLNAGAYASALRHGGDGDRSLADTEITRTVDGPLQYELVPSFRRETRGTVLTTNRWGMRDRDYPIAKPTGVHRIAVLGASNTMGAHVADGEVFEALVETSLNRVAGARYEQYDVLNFAVTGYSLSQKLAAAREKVPPFEPDVVVLVVHKREVERLLASLESFVRSASTPEPYLDAVLREAGVRPGLSSAAVRRRLRPYVDDAIRWSVVEIASASRAAGAIPVVFYIPMTDEAERADADRRAVLQDAAARAGALFLSAEDAFAGHREADIRIGDRNPHPNVLGHRLLADRLFALLVEHEARLRLGLPTSAATSAAAPSSLPPSPETLR